MILLPNNTKLPFDPGNRARYRNAMFWNEWENWGTYLGTGRTRNYPAKFLSFKFARAFVRKLHLRGTAEWVSWYKSSKRPANIPSDPKTVYKNQFKGMYDWLGKTKPTKAEQKQNEKQNSLRRSREYYARHKGDAEFRKMRNAATRACRNNNK